MKIDNRTSADFPPAIAIHPATIGAPIRCSQRVAEMLIAEETKTIADTSARYTRMRQHLREIERRSPLSAADLAWLQRSPLATSSAEAIQQLDALAILLRSARRRRGRLIKTRDKCAGKGESCRNT